MHLVLITPVQFAFGKVTNHCHYSHHQAPAHASASPAACSRSQCRTGWKETGVVGCYRCPTGYIDCGGTCAKGTSGWDCVNPFNWDRKVYETSYYDYRLPANDVGLL